MATASTPARRLTDPAIKKAAAAARRPSSRCSKLGERPGVEGEGEQVQHLDGVGERAVREEGRHHHPLAMQVAFGNRQVVGEAIPAVVGKPGGEERADHQHTGGQGEPPGTP